MTVRKYDEHGLPVLPEGYFWRIKPNGLTGSPYLHLMKEVDLYFFKFNWSLRNEFLGYTITYRWTKDAGDRILDWLEKRPNPYTPSYTETMYGDHHRTKR